MSVCNFDWYNTYLYNESSRPANRELNLPENSSRPSVLLFSYGHKKMVCMRSYLPAPKTCLRQAYLVTYLLAC